MMIMACDQNAVIATEGLWDQLCYRGLVGSTVLQKIAAKHAWASVLMAGVLIMHDKVWPDVAAVISDLLHRYGWKVLFYSYTVLI
jgi:hypothetical protein